MKTEKRLTMALSVLVALMMLAVPLASSSNLFVDGGQTNSNGDAPSLSADAPEGTFILYFDFNAPANSLDVAKLKNDSAPTNINDKVQFAKITDEETDKDLILAYVSQDNTKQVTIGQIIAAVNAAIERFGYTPVSWSTSNGNSYTDKDLGDTNYVTKNMNFTVNWELSNVKTINSNNESVTYEFKEFNVNVKVNGGEAKPYVKAYLVTEDANGEPIIEFNKTIGTATNLPIGIGTTYVSVPDIDSKGFLVTEYDAVNPQEDKYYKEVYSVSVKDSDKKTIFDSTLDSQDSNAKSVSGDNAKNSFDVTYDLVSTYTQITISSILFDEDVVVFAYKGHSFTYNDLLVFLTNVGPEDETENFVVATASNINDTTGRLLTTDEKYALTGWNGSVLLNSTEKVTETSLTLDAELNSYKVVFMVNGQYEVIEVPFGTELSADMTSLNTSGVNHWVTPAKSNGTYVDITDSTSTFDGFTQFRFNSNEVDAAEGLKTFTLIACYQSINKTAYAIFEANGGDFGDELVTKIVIPGEINTSVSQLPADPVKTGKNLFVFWESKNYKNEAGVYTYVETPENNATAVAYSSSQKYGAQDNVSTYTAHWQPYNHTVTFNADNNVNGVLYYKGDQIIKSAEDLKSKAVAIEYDGKIYLQPANPEPSATEETKEQKEFNDAYDKILKDSKDGYSVKQWNDSNGNAMITFKNKAVDKINIKEIKSDIVLSAQFEAKEYVIAYNGNTATATNNMPQIGTVDSAVNLFSDAAFSNDGYKLKEWNTRPDGKGTTYALGASFTLNGEQFEDLDKAPTGDGLPSDSSYEKGFTLYAIWEKVGSSGSGSGDNNEGNDGNNTDTYLLAGILAVIIILIILIAFLMKRKN